MRSLGLGIRSLAGVSDSPSSEATPARPSGDYVALTLTTFARARYAITIKAR